MSVLFFLEKKNRVIVRIANHVGEMAVNAKTYYARHPSWSVAGAEIA